jgi:hypothetical protein
MIRWILMISDSDTLARRALEPHHEGVREVHGRQDDRVDADGRVGADPKARERPRVLLDRTSASV